MSAAAYSYALPLAAVLLASACTTAAYAAEASEAQQVSEVVVTGKLEAKSAGQVATTQRLGVLGDRDTFSTPFSVSGYTEKLIQDQQARSISDIVANDPSVRTSGARYADSESQVIRGFPVFGDAVTFAGVPGLIDYRRPSIEGAARVDVFKGPNALLNNAVGNFAVGGSVNIEPKRAASEPLNRLIASYVSDGEGELQGDFGRRFGPNDLFGVRANLAGRSGDTPIDNQREDFGIGTLALDVRGERARASLDVSHEERTLFAEQTGFNIAPGVPIPKAPDASLNIYDRSTRFDQHDTLVLLKGEYDITRHISVFGAYGQHVGVERYEGPYSPTIINAAGDVSVYANIPYYRRPSIDVGRLGARADFATGPIHHEVSLVGDVYESTTDQFFALQGTLLTNLYRPVPLAPLAPPTVIDVNPPKTSASTRNSLAAIDVATLFEGRLTLIGGLRQQSIEDISYSGATGAVTTRYAKDATTPSIAFLVKLTPRLSVYGNYIEALQSGPTAPNTVVNAGEVFAPFVAEQYEAGAKYDLGKLGLTLALFQITQPSALTDARTNRFGVDGEQRNRGIELNAFGEVAPGLRMLGGAAFTDGEQTKTAGGVNDGKTAVGTPDTQANLGVEWDLPRAPGLTLTGRVIYTSGQFYDAANTQSIPDWTRVDLGARYAFSVRGRPTVLRASVENVSGADYWQSASRSYLTLGAPRTVLLSVSTDF